IFCVPGAGASVISFEELARALGREWPIYGLQPRGIDGRLIPHSTVSSAAESYVRAITQVQPEGPVHLLGHSFGGWVVFEMAQRLRAAGRTVVSLTIIDSEVPDGDQGREYTDTEVFVELVKVFEQYAASSLEITSRDLELRDESARLGLLHEQLMRVGIIPQRSNAEVLRGPVRTFAACLRTHYQPEGIYPGLLRIVLVDDSNLDDKANQRRYEQHIAGWRRWAPDIIAWHGPGNHMTVLKPPHVYNVATWLSLGLERGYTQAPICDQDGRKELIHE
ncbi:MAG: alpha/beta fold hydrolase, partial [Acidobacteriaceae bacterium]|nr:alpha/beta fold hydrolase [Acidobacteriaceae bacterium]